MTIGIIDAIDALDSCCSLTHGHPVNFGTTIVSTKSVAGPIIFAGRNSMHHYNNQGHSLLSAKIAIYSILGSCTDRSSLWAINVENYYHEEKKTS